MVQISCRLKLFKTENFFYENAKTLWINKYTKTFPQCYFVLTKKNFHEKKPFSRTHLSRFWHKYTSFYRFLPSPMRHSLNNLLRMTELYSQEKENNLQKLVWEISLGDKFFSPQIRHNFIKQIIFTGILLIKEKFKT